jgi:hypothetical protein
MIERLLLDVHGQCRDFPAGRQSGPPSGAAEALAAAAADATRLLTDWGPGAVMGVATLAGTATTAAALLEKRLRDQGETDDISHLLVHQSQTRGGSTELIYTAVPVPAWLRYQQLAADQPQLVLLHDWTRALIEWCRRRELESGPLLVMHPLGLDVLLLSAGRVRALERLRVFPGEADAWGQLGARVAAMVRQHGSPESTAGTAPAAPMVMWVLQGVEAELQPLLGGLGPMTLAECWAEAPAAVQAALDGAPRPVQVQALDLAALTVALPLRHAVGRRVDQAAAWAERWLPALALAGLALSVIIGGTAAFMHHRNALALALLPGQPTSHALWSTLGESVQQADLLAERQKDRRQWLQQRLDASKLPDMEMVLAHVRRSLPPGLVVDEVGLVVEKDSHLLTIVGHASGVGDSLHSESAFARALQTDGFTMKKRDLLLRDGQPGFKLSMTWSAS